MNKTKKIILPKDNGSHDFVIEWWYFNGFLHDAQGRKYSFMDCFFKVDLEKVNIPHLLPSRVEERLKNGKFIHFAHSVISDISRKKIYKEIQNFSLISKDTFKKDLLFINYKNFNILGENLDSGIIETSPNNFNIKTKHLDLYLESRKSPLLEGGHGYVGTPKDGSYYYSLTDLSVKGKINIEGKEVAVKGKAWMDHQWANTTYKKDKWTWFSFNLENGTEIMCVEYDTGTGVDILINTIDRKGCQKQYKKAKLVPAGKFWKSKKTKAKYPLAWEILIPEAKMEIKTSSFIKDQEMIFGQINYWEGPIKVVVKINKKKIKGNGFMELVGYPSDYNYLALIGKETEKEVFKRVKNLL